MHDQDLQNRFRFFLEHAGWSEPPGRAACALSLARAERALEDAVDAGAAVVQWRYDEEPYDPGDGISAEDAAAKFASNEWTGPFACLIYVGAELEPDPYNEERPPAGADNQASLWGIVVGQRGTRDPYCRVVEAELAEELAEELEQATADRRDVAEGIGA